jgi:hypothetical protein
MTANDIANLRLIHQQIAQPMYKTSAQVVAGLGAMQAQDYVGALWSMGLLGNLEANDDEEAGAD